MPDRLNSASSRPRKTLRAGTLASALVAGMSCACWFCLWLSHYEVAPSADFSQLADTELESCLRRMLNQNDAGRAIVVEALAAYRSALRRAASRVLHEAVDQATRQPVDEQVLDRLAQGLASVVDRLDSEGLLFATGVAERITAVTTPGSDAGERLRDCHIVLATQAEARLRQRFAERNRGTSPGERTAEQSQRVVR